MDTQATFAERLIERQMLSSEEMERVRKLQDEQQAPLSRLVVELGFLSAGNIERSGAAQSAYWQTHFDRPSDRLEGKNSRRGIG